MSDNIRLLIDNFAFRLKNEHYLLLALAIKNVVLPLLRMLKKKQLVVPLYELCFRNLVMESG